MREGPRLREPPPWEDPSWRPAAEAWIGDQLERVGLRVVGPLEPRPRPWSIVLRVPTNDGACFFKATAPGMANDAALTAALATLAPEIVLTPLAFDADRRWMLLPDGGHRLREVLAADRDLGHWERILPAYAELQRRMEGRGAELLALGALDRRPSQLPHLLTMLLDEPAWLMVGEPEGPTAGQARGLRDLVPRLAEAGDELEASGIGSSIQHDDLHDGNVLVAQDGYRLLDWGDASLAHPFGSLLVTLRSVGDTFGLGDWTPNGAVAPELDRLRDAYLETWSDRLPPARLVALVRLATWTGMVARALAWRAALPHATAPERAEWGEAIPAWLIELATSRPA